MFIKDVKLILHERRMMIVLALTAAVLIMGACFAKPYMAGVKVRFGVADLDDSEYSRLLIAYFEQSESFSSYVELVAGTEEELAASFKNRDIDLYLVIPKDFAAKLMNIDNVPIRAVIDSSDKTKAVLYKNLLEAYGNYISAVEVNAQAVYDLMGEEGYDTDTRSKVNYSLSYDLIFTALGKDEFFKRKESERIKGVDLVNYYVYSLLGLIIMYTGMIAGLDFLIERKSLAGARLKALGYGAFCRYLSKLAAFLCIGGTALLILLLCINAGGKMHFDAGSIFVVILSLGLACAFFMAISFAGMSTGGYITFSNMLILMLTIVGGGIIPIMYLPEAMSRVAMFTPLYRFIRAML
ncbi:MAG: ABC transporter permease [Lachnospiraceae bacterium]|nr:ABC transporter permease [Lachnospiraceae bacterium]